MNKQKASNVSIQCLKIITGETLVCSVEKNEKYNLSNVMLLNTMILSDGSMTYYLIPYMAFIEKGDRSFSLNENHIIFEKTPDKDLLSDYLVSVMNEKMQDMTTKTKETMEIKKLH